MKRDPRPPRGLRTAHGYPAQGCNDHATDQTIRILFNLGFKLKSDGLECEDINECEDKPCDKNADCLNTEGGFTCECNAGYAGDGFSCEDIDECSLQDDRKHTCSVNADCINKQGSYKCKCKEGFLGDGVTCTDIDECDGTRNNVPDNILIFYKFSSVI